jgi:hypothetical protein
MPPRPLTHLRKLCLALPEAREVEAWGEPTFRVGRARRAAPRRVPPGRAEAAGGAARATVTHSADVDPTGAGPCGR